VENNALTATEPREREGSARMTQEIVARRRAEQALEASEVRFGLFVQSVKDYAIFMLDSTGHVQSWNEGAHRIKGYTAQEIIGKHFSVFYPEEDIRSGKPAFELKEAAAVGRFEDEGWRLRKDGTQFWANVVITAVRDETGELIGFGKVTRDMTELRITQLRLLAEARRAADMEASARTKAEFLTAMSHELRTPLNAIGGYVDLLAAGLRGPLTEEQKQDLERIRLSQRHLLGIINDLLNFSRIEAGRVTYELAAVMIGEVIDAVTPMISPQAIAKGLTFDKQTCEPDMVAYVDRVKTEQILLNLLSNAVKYTESGGTISISCELVGDRVHVSVIDSGPGIPVDKQEAIFEPFVQLGRTWSSGMEGTGLGLSISRGLARAMGGDLQVRSEPGEGSAFILILPAA
jgi:PAS domain S-box-containing protein